MENKTICAIPWMHLNFEPDGKVVPCCLTSHHAYYAGDLSKNSVEEIWNSDNMKSLRKDMMSGVEPKICDKCFNSERVTGVSNRVYRNNEFVDLLDKIPEITEEDGTCKTMELKYWDFRFSNLCNFKCRSCGPRYSSAWVPDAKKMGYAMDQEKVWNIEAVNESTNFEFLKEQVQHVKRIYFAGGEPLMMPEHWQIMDMLVENKRFDVKVSYNTNLSSFNHSGRNAFDYWKLWDHHKLEVWPSIDELGERAELLRSGTVWSKVDHNLRQLLTLNDIVILPNITVGLYNINRLPEIIDYLAEVGICEFNEGRRFFTTNIIDEPAHYKIQGLPDDFKNRTIDKLQNYIITFKQKYGLDISQDLKHVINELRQPHNPYMAIKFIHTTNKLDKIRNENMLAVIPEMKEVYDLYDGY